MTKRKGHRRMAASPLASHHRQGDLLSSPANRLLNPSFSSWINEALPEVLWSALLATNLPRVKALETFRAIVTKQIENKTAFEKRRLEHSYLSELDDDTFKNVFAEQCKREEVARTLSPLLLLERLPDRQHWEKMLPAPNERVGWGALMNAVAACYDHQSRQSTDCRWLKIRSAMAKDTFHYPAEMEERFEQYRKYPNEGDQDKLGGSIRALEMTLRRGVGNEPPAAWPGYFWEDAWKKTSCIPANLDENARVEDYEDLIGIVESVYEALMKHFQTTISTTDVDARHDGSFGLAFYVMHLTFLALKSSVGQTVQGRLVLRSAVEAVIILTFLAKKDDPTIWLQYRHYGSGQAKLAFLKFKEEDAPGFVTKELLEQLANFDAWMEFQDIKLGAWADKNLRKMAEEANIKPLYDKYYDALSGYMHSNWAAVGHSVFGVCLNPLHRFHRIPTSPRFFTDDAVPDLIKLINISLDRITMLYPPFKDRVRREADPAAKA